MARMTISGLKEVEAMLDNLGAQSEEIAKKALYQGAGVVADAVKQGIESIPTDENWGTPKHPKAGPTQKEKDGLKESMGISVMETKGNKTDVSVGFDGYNGQLSRHWPQGEPNAMVARSVERGTSFMKSTKFIKTAVSGVKAKTEAVMEETVKEEIQKRTK